MFKNKRIGLVLSGGGIRGMAHIGLIKAMPFLEHFAVIIKKFIAKLFAPLCNITKFSQVCRVVIGFGHASNFYVTPKLTTNITIVFCCNLQKSISICNRLVMQPVYQLNIKMTIRLIYLHYGTIQKCTFVIKGIDV